MLPIPDMICLIVMFGLCALGRPFNVGVSVCCSLSFSQEMSLYFSNLLISLIHLCLSFVTLFSFIC